MAEKPATRAERTLCERQIRQQFGSSRTRAVRLRVLESEECGNCTHLIIKSQSREGRKFGCTQGHNPEDRYSFFTTPLGQEPPACPDFQQMR